MYLLTYSTYLPTFGYNTYALILSRAIHILSLPISVYVNVSNFYYFYFYFYTLYYYYYYYYYDYYNYFSPGDFFKRQLKKCIAQDYVHDKVKKKKNHRT